MSWTWTIGALATLVLAACSLPTAVPSGADAAAARITGSVGHADATAPPSGAVIRVQLLDVSRVDAPSVVVGERRIPVDGQRLPVMFDIPYDASRIQARNTYAVRAWLEDAQGRMRFTTDRRYAVITQGAPTHVDLVMRAVGQRDPASR